MSILLKNARIIDPEAQEVIEGAVLIEKGEIATVFTGEPDASINAKEEIDCQGKYVAPGIIDIGVKIGEPGERHKESFASAGAAAASGGITTMVLRPDTKPAVDSPETLEFIYRRAISDSAVRVLSMAALTRNRAGKEMAELAFLKDAGAVAFSDGDQVIDDNKVFTRCLSYAKGLDALVITHAQERSLSDGACATSGKIATKLGLPAVSPMAERLQLQRDLTLVEMTGTRIHVDQITAEAGLPVLARAKAKGLPVTAGTSIHHLTLNELDIEGYRTFFKLKPPLRSEEDRLAIIDALSEGVIDVISSMHTPQDEESKRIPFQEAASGAVGLETLLPAALRLYHAGHLSLPQLWRAMSLRPAQILGIPQGRMSKGAPADLVLFDKDVPFTLDRFSLNSKSHNTPFDGALMQGKVSRTFLAGREIYRG